MDQTTYDKNMRRGYYNLLLLIAGIIMLFEKINYSITVCVIMILLAIGWIIIIKYNQKKQNIQKARNIIMEKLAEEFIKSFEDFANIEKPKIEKEMKIINTFGRKYKLENLCILNIISRWSNIFKRHIEKNNLESLNNSKLNVL